MEASNAISRFVKFNETERWGVRLYEPKLENIENLIILVEGLAPCTRRNDPTPG